ncbi:MAG: hypothetical protein AABZ47_06805, partial [Planctomycetota bacterium]
MTTFRNHLLNEISVQNQGDLQQEYRSIQEGCALVNRANRGWIELSGGDRATWLHNLLTNHVKTLQCGEGTYAFAVNIQGRIVFDVHVFARASTLWLEMDRVLIEPAIRHLSKYAIVEDVALQDQSETRIRLGLCGKRAGDVLGHLGASHAHRMPLFNMTEFVWEESTVEIGRTDFCGPLGFDLWVKPAIAERFVEHLISPASSLFVTPVREEAVRVHQIEFGIPVAGSEITDEVLPAETGELQWAVSFNKGCYLGQEV